MKRQENRAVIAWRGAASAGLVSSADRAYMKAPSLVLRRTSGQNVPNLWTHSRKSRQIFLSKLKWAEAILGLSRLDYPLAKTGGAVNGGAFICTVHLDR